MTQEKDGVQFQLGQLTGEMQGVKDSMDAVSEAVNKSTSAISSLAEHVGLVVGQVNSLPCSERLDACQREMSGLHKRINGLAQERQSTSARRWGIMGAILGGIIIGIVDALARFFWR